MGYFEKIINKEDFLIETDYQLTELLGEKWGIERIVGFKMQFTTEFYDYHSKFMGGLRVHEVKLEDVNKEIVEEIIYFFNLKKEKELKKEEEKEQEAISNEINKNEYNKFLTLQRKRLLWKQFKKYEYNEVFKDFNFEEQNITITIK